MSYNHNIRTLPDFLTYHAKVQPEAPAFIVPGATEDDERIVTYRKAAELVERYASGLAAAGVVRGDRVVVRLPKSVEGMLLFFAVMRTGGIYVPISLDFTPREARVLIEDSGPALLVDNDPETLDLPDGSPLRRARFGTGTADDVAQNTGEKTCAAPAPDDGAVMLFTSGTTGHPKGAKLTHANLLSNLAALGDAWHFSTEDRLLHVLPVFHGHGLYLGIAMPLVHGSSVILLPRFDAAETVRLLPRATVLMAVPQIYTRLLDRPDFDREACRGLRLATSGSAPLAPEVFETLRERTGLTVVERYGTTETCILTTNPANGTARVGSVGVPLSCVELRIANEGGRVMRTGTVGRVQVRGDSIIKEYWRRPDKADDWTSDGWFDTGDMGRVDEDGFVWLVGRGKDLIISGGYNVYPREVEIQIEAQEGVSEAAVFGVPHPDFGEGVVAAVKPKLSASLDILQINISLARVLANYKRPKRIVLVEDFPRNQMGKVLKTELRKIYADAFQTT